MEDSVDGSETYEIESIPVSDFVSRGCEFPNISPPAGVDPDSFFVFSTDQETKERAESLYWRKYAHEIEVVHHYECDRVRQSNERRSTNHNYIHHAYTGTRTALIEKILNIESNRGFSFTVDHAPEKGIRAHTHIFMPELHKDKITRTNKTDRMELIHYLCKAFGELEEHICVPVESIPTD